MKKALTLSLLALSSLVLFPSCYLKYTCTCINQDSTAIHTGNNYMLYKGEFNGPQNNAMSKCSAEKATLQRSGYANAFCTMPI